MRFEFPGNRTIARCPACGSECRRGLSGWWYAAYWVAWLAFSGVLVIHVVAGLSFGLALLVAVVFNVPFEIAARRVYHAAWMRRHPLRCQGGGHATPRLEGEGL